MSNILFLVPDESMVQYTSDVLSSHQHSNITVKTGYGYDAIPIAKQFLSDGGEVVIARAGTALILRNALDITIVETPITGFDIIRAVQEARTYGTNIAVIASNSMIEGIDYLAPILGVNLQQYPMDAPGEAEEVLSRALENKTDVVLGGVSACKAAKKRGIPYTGLLTSRESILLAVKEAKYVKYALRIEKAKRNMLNIVLDYSYEGIIVIDKDLKIVEFNPAAAKFSNINSSQALGQNVSEILPTLQLEKIMHSGKEELHFLLKIQGKHFLCNKVPIHLGNSIIGAVATMQDVTKIQEMEARIRQEFFSKGHIARFHFEDILGSSAAIKQTIETAKNFSETASNVLILGETGTGKEVFAQSIHNYSDRAQGPFVAVNCAALPAQLLESELFGYVAGAFTGANKTGKPGLFEVAHGGTIFLDEIAEMDYINQGRLLRVLQEKAVVRLGSDKVIPVDVRIIAATNKDLKTMVYEKKFRDDLYFRLNVLRLPLPSLRERAKDIPDYVRFFLEKHSANKKRKLVVLPHAMECLTTYSWPGNIRELQNTIERAVAVSKSDVIDELVFEKICGDEYIITKKEDPAEDEEAAIIRDALLEANGHQGEAAKILGIDRTTLWRKMKKLGMKRLGLLRK